MRTCYKCGAQLQERARVPLKELCPHCDSFLHCCRNCRHYAADRHNHCMSGTTEFVADIERGNYCDEFMFLEKEDPRAKAKAEEEAAKANSLAQAAKKRESETGPNGRSLSAREKFDKLFSD
jgi:hypothetical protein